MLSINFPLLFRQLFQAFFKTRGTHIRLTAKRLRFLLIFIILFFFAMTETWICFLLDYVFFPLFRRQPVKKPVFIIGNFRTGSTLLFRIMARDTRNFTSFKTWEIYVAPSLSQRKFIRGVLLLDSLLGRPIRRFLAFFDKKQLSSFRLHKVGLRESEEEEGILLYIWNSFWIRYFFPLPDQFAPYDYFDSLMPGPKRRRIMRFYRRMVQRHLYAHDHGKSLLSKNPCFTPKVQSLLETFPDARFIYLVRDPAETCTSKISWFSFLFNSFNSPLEHYPLKSETIEMMKLWYTYPVEVLKTLPKNQALILNYDDFVKNPETMIKFIYKKFNLPVTADFDQILAEETHRAKKFKSSRETTAESIGMSKKILHDHFDDIYDYYRRFRFDRP
jgi:omega-hydroxy-beta-dihydromenaquinone-9 sulfotransferase